MKNKVGRYLLGGLIVIILIFCIPEGEGQETVTSNTNSNIPIATEAVSVATVESIFESTGRVLSTNAITVEPEVKANVESINVAVGEDVKAGDLLLSLKATDLEIQAELGLKQAISNHKLAREEADLRKKKYEDIKVLFKSGAVSEDTYKEVKLAYEASEENLQIASKNIESQRVVLDEVANKFDIVSPLNGKIIDINGVVGQFSDSGVGVTIQGDKGYEVIVGVPESIIDEIHLGTVGYIDLESKDERIGGKVVKVLEDVDQALGLYRVTLKLDHHDALKSGQFARVALVVKTEFNQVMVPHLAVLRDGERQYVYTYTDEVLQKKEVVTGVPQHEKLQILSGLDPHDIIVVKGQTFITEKSKVTVD